MWNIIVGCSIQRLSWFPSWAVKSVSKRWLLSKVIDTNNTLTGFSIILYSKDRLRSYDDALTYLPTFISTE